MAGCGFTSMAWDQGHARKKLQVPTSNIKRTSNQPCPWSNAKKEKPEYGCGGLLGLLGSSTSRSPKQNGCGDLHLSPPFRASFDHHSRLKLILFRRRSK
jgi:hypothetical protein